MYTRVVKANTWKWLCGIGCFFIPELFPGGRCVPEGSRCHCEATSLSPWCPFSPLPTVTCYLRSPRHMCTSLEQGYSYLCLQEVCSVFPAFKWLNRTFRLLYGNLTNASHLGKHERNWCFPVFHRTNERLAETSTKLEVQKQQNRSLLSTLTTRPVLERPGIGNFNNTRMFNSTLSKSKPRVFYLSSTPFK